MTLAPPPDTTRPTDLTTRNSAHPSCPAFGAGGTQPPIRGGRGTRAPNGRHPRSRPGRASPPPATIIIDIFLTCRQKWRRPGVVLAHGQGCGPGSRSEGDGNAMSLHGLTSITLGVPDVDAVASYYEDFGLRRVGDRPGRGLVFATADGGEQLALRPAERRRLLEIGIGADDPDDLGRVEAGLRRLGAEFERDAAGLRVRDPNSALQVSVQVSPRITEAAAKQEPTNGPGRPDRPNGRAPAIERTGRVQPRRLGHVVVGSLDQEASQRFFTEGLGFKVSDRVPGLASFMRCSTDHHNLLVQQAPLNFLHHTAWEVDDVDEVGRGATAMLEGHPERHIWGLGRHHLGSNFFWYLKDPVGNFSEYYSDLDIILDDQLWKPSVVEGARGLYNWGPPPPPSFIHPEDLAALMTGSHAPKA